MWCYSYCCFVRRGESALPAHTWIIYIACEPVVHRTCGEVSFLRGQLNSLFQTRKQVRMSSTNTHFSATLSQLPTQQIDLVTGWPRQSAGPGKEPHPDGGHTFSNQTNLPHLLVITPRPSQH